MQQNSALPQGTAIVIKFPDRRPAAPAASPLDTAPPAPVPLAFRVSPEFRRAFTQFCTRHGLTRREALERAFELLHREREGRD